MGGRRGLDPSPQETGAAIADSLGGLAISLGMPFKRGELSFNGEALALSDTVTRAAMKEVLTCPGCLEPFGITSAQRYEHFCRDASVEDASTAPVLKSHPGLGLVPVAKPDPAGGYRCPRCGHVVA